MIITIVVTITMIIMIAIILTKTTAIVIAIVIVPLGWFKVIYPGKVTKRPKIRMVPLNKIHT